MSDTNRTPIIPGLIKEDRVLCTGDYSISLYNKGHYGTPNKLGVSLDGFEALHLMELGRIEISNDLGVVQPNYVSRYFAEKIQNFMVRYYVYKDLRNRGYVVNLGSGSSFFFRLYQRDSKPKEVSAKYYVTALHEGGSIPLDEMNDLIVTAERSKKILLLGMVDATGDVSYLRVEQLDPKNISTEHPNRLPSKWNWDSATEEFRVKFS